MPKRRRQPQVKPLQRYRAPKYPSHQDPDPTQHPYPVPYPFAPRLAATVAGLGILVGCEGQGDPAARGGPAAPQVAAAGRSLPVLPPPGDEPEAEAKFPVREPVVEIDDDPDPAAPKTNTLPLETSGLPHRTSMFGTGAQSYLSEDMARAVIERAFAAAGYELDRDVQLKQEGLAFVADGYDPEQKVGYVWADYGSLDHDGVVSWQDSQEAGPDPAQRLAWLERQVQHNAALADLADPLEAAQRVQDRARRVAAIEALVEQAQQRLLSMDEAKLLEARAGREGFVAVVSQFDSRFTYQGWDVSDELREELREAEQLPDPAKRALAVRAVREKILRVPLGKLERAVREYLAWARTQGG